uniref:non-specific serine/threonine protein kinase n=1 Tax=Timema douglasi TaxID=61478 RepID=A0A7R8Z6Z9_TIMDO|nr:unnamed protein product [Timema douglasi]
MASNEAEVWGYLYPYKVEYDCLETTIRRSFSQVSYPPTAMNMLHPVSRVCGSEKGVGHATRGYICRRMNRREYVGAGSKEKTLPSTIAPEPALREQQCSLYQVVPPSSQPSFYVRMRTTVKYHVAGTVKRTGVLQFRSAYTRATTGPVERRFDDGRSPMASLVLTDSSQLTSDSQHLEMRKDEYCVGREGCDLILPEKTANVSRKHFSVSRADGRIVLKDWSLNGTYVNGTEVGKDRTVPLRHNDLIALVSPEMKTFVFMTTKDAKGHHDYHPDEVKEKYLVSFVIGEGGYGQVSLVFDKGWRLANKLGAGSDQLSGSVRADRLANKLGTGSGQLSGSVRVDRLANKLGTGSGQLSGSVRVDRLANKLGTGSGPAGWEYNAAKDEIIVRPRSSVLWVVSTKIVFRSPTTQMRPFVIHFKELINTSDSLCILLEMMEGGDLYARIDPENTLTEDTIKLIFFQTVSAVKYLHDQGITHRDLKFTSTCKLNSLGEEEGGKASVCIDIFAHTPMTDFGVSKKETNMQTVIGTLFFIAPEILKQHFQQRTYTNQVDIWSLGVILFNCISSDLPFKNPAQTLMSDFSFDENPKWEETSPDVKDLISEMLIKDPVDRITLDEIFRHPWLQDEEMKKTLYTLMWERQVLQFHEMARDVLGPIKWKDVRT